MPIVIINEKGNGENMDEQIADRHYWLDKDGNVTTDEAESHQWLVREGSPISKQVADKYGIGKVAQPVEESGNETIEKSTGPSENKVKTPGKNKGAK